MGVDPDQVTVSGFSNGASIAMNILVAYSDIISGAELFLGRSLGVQ
jgi:predicted esterase